MMLNRAEEFMQPNIKVKDMALLLMLLQIGTVNLSRRLMRGPQIHRPVAGPAKRAISFICFQMLCESDEIELGSRSVPTSESVRSTALFWGWEEQETLGLSLSLLKGSGFGLKRGTEDGEGEWRRRREETGKRRRGFEEATKRRPMERLKKEDENERKGNGEERKMWRY
ncbi:uncharacterized protein A4U43_C01F11560 [Asparagus officinalis]|uniref:Uncharacterized protein n=1 Tax=Asparagus officinalis TaxID=4686 RepID=A0A5P1FT57_ASPOF|nr:uncharacterized protein A4U43_C01F11560 [Asparagus officinalis]